MNLLLPLRRSTKMWTDNTERIQSYYRQIDKHRERGQYNEKGISLDVGFDHSCVGHHSAGNYYARATENDPPDCLPADGLGRQD